MPNSDKPIPLPDLPDDSTVAGDEDNPEEENDSGLFEHYRITADRGQGLLRIDKFLTAHIMGASRNRIQQAIDAGYV